MVESVIFSVGFIVAMIFGAAAGMYMGLKSDAKIEPVHSDIDTPTNS